MSGLASKARSRPILFSGPMIRALLAGSKTQTRRIVKPQPESRPGMNCMRLVFKHRDGRSRMDVAQESPEVYGGLCPYGGFSDLLWVRETWRVSKKHDTVAPRNLPHARGMTVMFSAGGSRAHDDTGHYVNDDTYPDPLPDWAGKLRPSIFMPRWASRITLRLTAVRVERLQEISRADAKAEGLSWVGDGCSPYGIPGLPSSWNADPRESYRALWESINGAKAWEANPFVWAVAFERVRCG